MTAMARCPFDFHLHSCLSPCGDDDMTPANIAAMCALAGYAVVALTDHNTTGNCAAFCRAAEDHGLLALPGMELTVAEEAHIVCLFPDLDSAAAFGELVRRRLPPIQNRPEFFGRQLLMDSRDAVLGEETALLAGTTSIRAAEVLPLMREYGGVAYPAHIDRDSFSLLSNLGLWDPSLGFTLAELSLRCPPELRRRPDLAGVRFLTGCDAHYLHQIPDPSQALELPSKTVKSVLSSLKTYSSYVD